MPADRIGCHSSVFACLGVLIRPAVPADAIDRWRLPGVELLRQHDVSLGAELLLRDHVSGIQR